MKTRAEIKSHSREMLREQRGIAILLGLIVAIIAIAVSSIALIPMLVSGSLESLGIANLLSMVTSLFIIVLAVGVAGSYSKIYRGEAASLGDMFSITFTKLDRKLGGMLWMSLFIFLWSLLFVIPGIIKAYSYSMTPYILAEHPEVKATEALNISKRMTKGHKFDLFVLDLSFIGWGLLSSLTFGILAIVFVGPYYSISMSGYYNEIKAHALASGVVTREEFGI